MKPVLDHNASVHDHKQTRTLRELSGLPVFQA